MTVVSMGTNVGGGSSDDNSSDSNHRAPQFEGPNIVDEKRLPSVVSGGADTWGLLREITAQHNTHTHGCVITGHCNAECLYVGE